MKKYKCAICKNLTEVVGGSINDCKKHSLIFPKLHGRICKDCLIKLLRNKNKKLERKLRLYDRAILILKKYEYVKNVTWNDSKTHCFVCEISPREDPLTGEIKYYHFLGCELKAILNEDRDINNS